jgi:hypothetical protein
MEENEYQLIQQELEVHEVMKVHCEEGVFPSIYPWLEFMSAVGILEDFLLLVDRVGLTTYMLDESNQYAMLTKIFVESSTEG